MFISSFLLLFFWLLPSFERLFFFSLFALLNFDVCPFLPQVSPQTPVFNCSSSSFCCLLGSRSVRMFTHGGSDGSCQVPGQPKQTPSDIKSIKTSRTFFIFSSSSFCAFSCFHWNNLLLSLPLPSGDTAACPLKRTRRWTGGLKRFFFFFEHWKWDLLITCL